MYSVNTSSEIRSNELKLEILRVSFNFLLYKNPICLKSGVSRQVYPGLSGAEVELWQGGEDNILCHSQNNFVKKLQFFPHKKKTMSEEEKIK